jgi:glutamine amidotransferase
MGWNILQKKENALEWPDILDGIDKEGEVYFVHSYEGKPANDINRVADTIYGGRQVCAIVQNKNVIGCQFHPEKSGDIGLNILKNFIKKF